MVMRLAIHHGIARVRLRPAALDETDAECQASVVIRALGDVDEQDMSDIEGITVLDAGD